MNNLIEVRVPDIGDFKDVEVIEVLVKSGDVIKPEDSLIALESDKATMEVPAPAGGTVKDLKIKVGDKVSQGSLILMLEAGAVATPSALRASAPPTAASATAPTAPRSAATPPKQTSGADITTEVVVLGAGPGGYTAAFRAADLGKQVTLIERYAALGGVCLNVGCIPSKALLHVAKVLTEAEAAAEHGVEFGKPKIDFGKVQGWKTSVVDKHTKGLTGLAKQRKITVVHGTAKFVNSHQVQVQTSEGNRTIGFQHAIIAAGSQAFKLPGLPWGDARLLDSTDALALKAIPKRMLIIGGGIIGLEMATVYDALGSKISVVELMDNLIPGCDPDLVRPLARRIGKRYEQILLKTKVTKIEAKPEGLLAHFEGAQASDAAPQPQLFDAVLVAVGRRPNGKAIGAEAAGVKVDERGYIPVDKQQRTNIGHIFAIGDIVGEPMLAHKATHEAKVAAEVIAGHKAAFDARAIPNVAYTDPEVAWMGLSETEAKKRATQIEVAAFPWTASGRASGQARNEGVTKLIFEAGTRRLLGAGMVGPNAGELIAEAVLALEMGADATDLSLTIHPHPTLSETLGLAAEMAEGSITDLLPAKKNRA
jgi:dihydrolipoamide dehydrogenase